MTREPLAFLALAVDIGVALLLLSIVLAVVRLIRGPTLPDRIIALDLIGILAVALITLVAIRAAQPAFLDAAIALALVAFLGTVAYARFVERQSDEATQTDSTDDR